MATLAERTWYPHDTLGLGLHGSTTTGIGRRGQRDRRHAPPDDQDPGGPASPACSPRGTLVGLAPRMAGTPTRGDTRENLALAVA
ncbi:hypothetical protein [Phytohalomonas tamaricis]|uniref:hypothetical protein n=1 Tax=Phytohalomonas tamaricis TaxID=2081032 RepID=UPI00374E1020